MSARIYAPIAALLLTACATAQENPNYQFSSKYGQPGTDGVSETVTAQPVQSAVYSAPEAVSPETYSGTYQVQAYPDYDASNTVITASTNPPVSPTEQAYDSSTMAGTPGYSVYIPDDAPTVATPKSPMPVSNAPSGPRAVDYDYSQNMSGALGAPAPIPVTDPMEMPDPMTAPQDFAPIGTSYTVQPGDTVYSMSRRLCVPLSDIMSANGIGADYAISIGQTLTLPASRC